MGDPDVSCSDSGDCQEAIERLYHYLDGELTDERREVIRRHLDDCGYCLEAFDFEAELRSTIASKCKDRVPEGLIAKVAEAIQREHVGTPGPDGAGV